MLIYVYIACRGILPQQWRINIEKNMETKDHFQGVTELCYAGFRSGLG